MPDKTAARPEQFAYVQMIAIPVDPAIDLKDAHRADQLTARQAGTLARLAGVKGLVTLHNSPRYKGQGQRLAEEARDAFVGG
jgi:hypothetical protein